MIFFFLFCYVFFFLICDSLFVILQFDYLNFLSFLHDLIV